MESLRLIGQLTVLVSVVALGFYYLNSPTAAGLSLLLAGVCMFAVRRADRSMGLRRRAA